MDKSLLKLIHEIEYETGKLSQSDGSSCYDGSITRLLETYVDAPVGVRTIKQNIVTAPADIAEILEINPGDMVNYREVYLYNTCTNQALIHAISYAPLSHLPPRAIDRLMKEDEPIGLIMRDESMESRREIISIKTQ
jgi:chorismate-pyruvate lyase